MGAYAVGRRFEHWVIEKLRKHGIRGRRVVLSGRRHPDVIDADLVVEGKFFGKAKTTKAKRYVSFPSQEVKQLMKGKLDFLVFNFRRTPPFVVIRFKDFVDLIKVWKKRR
jgi:Holliday junction resolvase